MESILGSDGKLATVIDNFTPRPQQQELAQAIKSALKNNHSLVAEAGTGTGKTFAYLVPALLSGKKVIISTGTKNLQDQLFNRDLPLLRKALAIPAKVALLKGRANYLCHYRLDDPSSQQLFYSKQQVNEFKRIRRMASQTKQGDIAEITNVAEDSPVWSAVTSTAESCLSQDCQHFERCFVQKARRKALDADIIIINHHLFFADLALQEEGVGELLPTADLIIFDEAHQLYDVASLFFGQRISARQLLELITDTQQEYLKSAADADQLKDALARLKKAIADMRLSMGEAKQKAAWHTIAKQKAVTEATEQLQTELTFLSECLDANKERSKGLENCHRRSVELLQLFKSMTTAAPEDQIHWFETYSQSFAIYFTPMNIADDFQAHMQSKQRSWIFTSATMTIDNNFEHFLSQLGLNDTEQLQLDSPFNYQEHSLLYLPRNMPDPNSRDYVDAVINAALPVIEASPGGVFLLFTSYYALNKAAALLKDQLDTDLFIQGEQPKDKLLQAFRACDKAVLLGTSSFWEGVDVRGRALSCVIIDKIPFSTPDDPILQARSHVLRQQKKDPFYHHSLPHAVINMRQGAGRLIRDHDDKGVLMICDPRLQAREYGKTILASLPNMQRTRELSNVTDFFTKMNDHANEC